MDCKISPRPSFPKRGKFLPASTLSVVEGAKGGESLPSNGFIGGGIYKDHVVTILRPLISSLSGSIILINISSSVKGLSIKPKTPNFLASSLTSSVP